MAFLQPHTANITSHPASVTPLADKGGREVHNLNSFDLNLIEHDQTTLTFDLDLRPPTPEVFQVHTSKLNLNLEDITCL